MAQILAILFAIVLAEPQDGPAQVVDTGELMDIFIKPAYAELQQAMAKPPVDRKEWATIYQKAVRVAELSNLILFRTHEDARKPEWVATAGACAAGGWRRRRRGAARPAHREAGELHGGAREVSCRGRRVQRVPQHVRARCRHGEAVINDRRES